MLGWLCLTKAVVLDSSSAGLLDRRRGIPEDIQGILCESVDYELRRELIRLKICSSIARRDGLAVTYALFLLVFLVVPIAVLDIALRKHINTRLIISCAIVCGLAFVYTSPWDNYAAKTGLWAYDPKFAPPSHFVLYLPWEEYVFYFAQGILICLLVTALSKCLRPKTGEADL